MSKKSKSSSSLLPSEEITVKLKNKTNTTEQTFAIFLEKGLKIEAELTNRDEIVPFLYLESNIFSTFLLSAYVELEKKSSS